MIIYYLKNALKFYKYFPHTMKFLSSIPLYSKLFAKKLERLFDVDGNNPDSPESAATLFRFSTLIFMYFSL